MSEASSRVGHRDGSWLRVAQWARWLAWASLAWMTVEGTVGLVAGFQANSIALVGWALSSVVEGLASVIVIWRFTGSRTLFGNRGGPGVEGGGDQLLAARSPM